jgi:hypothetical protein
MATAAAIRPARLVRRPRRAGLDIGDAQAGRDGLGGLALQLGTQAGALAALGCSPLPQRQGFIPRGGNLFSTPASARQGH